VKIYQEEEGMKLGDLEATARGEHREPEKEIVRTAAKIDLK